MAEKLDTLVGFWAIDEKPTGSKDPYALRRAALGAIRIVLESNINLPIARVTSQKFSEFLASEQERIANVKVKAAKEIGVGAVLLVPGIATGNHKFGDSEVDGRALDLLSFFADRLKVYLKDQGQRHDLIDAVFSLGGQDDLLMIVKRVEALSKFLETDDGKNLLAGVKRANNILKIEEKKDAKSYSGDVIASQLVKGEEKALNSAIIVASGQAAKAVEAEDFEAAMAAIAKLRAPVDAFFEHVTVNDKDQSFRANRLNLLGRIRTATLAVADFTKIEG